jgi:hypothetical protein
MQQSPPNEQFPGFAPAVLHALSQSNGQRLVQTPMLLVLAADTNIGFPEFHQ